MSLLSKLCNEIMNARRNRDAVSNDPEAFRMANLKVQAAFEAWRTIANRGK